MKEAVKSRRWCWHGLPRQHAIKLLAGQAPRTAATEEVRERREGHSYSHSHTFAVDDRKKGEGVGARNRRADRAKDLRLTKVQNHVIGGKILRRGGAYPRCGAVSSGTVTSYILVEGRNISILIISTYTSPGGGLYVR